jgi:hypothetical protein
MKKPIKSLLLKIFRLIKILITVIYALNCWFWIFLLSNHSYESWVGEPDGDVPFTICTIPDSSDDSYGVGVLPTSILIIILLGFGLIGSIKKRRINLSLILSIILIVYWWYRFWGRTLFCPDPEIP